MLERRGHGIRTPYRKVDASRESTSKQRYFHADRLRSPRPSDRRERVSLLLALRAREWPQLSLGGLRRAGSGPCVQAERRAEAPRVLSSDPSRRLVEDCPSRTFRVGLSVGPDSPTVLPLNRGRFERRLRAVGAEGLPISGSRTYAGRNGPRGDPAGLVVLPPRVRREPDGGRLRRGPAYRLWPNARGSRAALRRCQDVAGPRRRHVVGGVPGSALDRTVQPLRAEFPVVVRTGRRGVRGVRGPGLRRAPRGPCGCVPQAANAQAPRCESPRPRP